MPTKRYEWSAADYATAMELADAAERHNLGFRELSTRSQGRITYSRVRDLLTAHNAPARFSEILLLCDLIGQTPLNFLARILERTRLLQERKSLITFTDNDGATPDETVLDTPPIINDEDARRLLDGTPPATADTDIRLIHRIVEDTLKDMGISHQSADEDM